MNESGVYSEADLEPFKSRLEELRQGAALRAVHL
jgi:hypothetical protein